MRALVGFVVGSDIEIAAIAVAALKNLASHGDNYEVLRSEDDLLEGLKDLLLAEESYRDLRREIFDILEELTDESLDEEMDELDDLEQKAGLTDAAVGNSYDDDPNLLKEPITTRLHIPGISDEVFCVRVEQLLIHKKGVISVVFEIGAELAVVYTRTLAEDLASFVGTMTGTSVEVLPEVLSDDEEEADAVAADSQDGVDKENGGGQPGYLDESGERFKDVAKKNGKKKKTITQGASSLAERLQAQREEESRKKARANRLMDSIGRGFNTGWGFF